jgi:hypothetical protein
MSVSTRDIKSQMPPGQRKPYPKGPKKTVTPAWKVVAQRKLTDLGKDHRWLEAQLRGPDGKPASRGSVTKLFSASQNTSAWVDQVCEVLGILPPVAEINDPDEFTLLEGYRRMPVEQRRYLLGLLGVGKRPTDDKQ